MSFMSKPRKKPLSTNNGTMALIITLVTWFQPLSSTLYDQDARHRAMVPLLPLDERARPPKMVAQKPGLACLDGGPARKITGMTVLTSRLAAGTSTFDPRSPAGRQVRRRPCC